MAPPLDMAKTLVRQVVRAFYDNNCVLIIDALIIHSALKDEDLRFMLGMNTKEVHRLCGKLREDRFITSYTRPEQSNNPEQKRPINKQYYFIDYRQAIDAIKWRVYTVDKEIQGTNIPVSERKEYFCGRCKAEWTQMEVLDKASSAGFLCHNCEYPLTHDLERHSTGHQESTRLNEQFKFITEMLPQIDDVVVPENTFDIAISTYKPLAPDTSQGPIGFVSSLQPTSVKGLDMGPKSLSVNISTSDGPSEAEKAAEQARKDKIAQQNALPSWMSNSTVTGESYTTAQTGPTPAVKTQSLDSKEAAAAGGDEQDDSEMAKMFAAIKAQQEADAARALAEEGSDEEDDDDEDDFEDVVATGNNSSGETPVSAATPAMKRSADSQEDSAEDLPAKRVKLESPAQQDDGDESEEDLEFEDVS